MAKWIQSAIKRKGALTAKAKRAGKSVSAYCSSLGPNADTRTKRQCALYRTLRRMSKKRKKVLVSAQFLYALLAKVKPFDYEAWATELDAQEE